MRKASSIRAKGFRHGAAASLVALLAAAPLAVASAQTDHLGHDAAAQDSARAEWDMIAFETKFWGRPMTSWQLVPTGGGSWVQSKPDEVSAAGPDTLVFHEIEVGEDGYRRIAEIFSHLPATAPDSSTCTNFMTDQPYGTARFSRGATTTEIAWNAGCMDEEYSAFLDTLKAADTQMREWGLASTITRTEKAS